MTATDTRRIYVASLSDYNAGRLHGEWIDVDGLDGDDIHEAVNEMLAASPELLTCQLCGERFDDPDALGIVNHLSENGHLYFPGNAEEWAIHDYEGFGDIRLSEWEQFDHVAKLAAALDEHGDAFAAFYANDSYDSLDDIVERFTESYAGEFDSIGDYAYELFRDTAPSNEVIEASERWPFTAVDWDAAGRDLVYGGDVWTADTSDYHIYVFRNY